MTPPLRPRRRSPPTPPTPRSSETQERRRRRRRQGRQHRATSSSATSKATMTAAVAAAATALVFSRREVGMDHCGVGGVARGISVVASFGVFVAAAAAAAGISARMSTPAGWKGVANGDAEPWSWSSTLVRSVLVTHGSSEHSSRRHDDDDDDDDGKETETLRAAGNGDGDGEGDGKGAETLLRADPARRGMRSRQDQAVNGDVVDKAGGGQKVAAPPDDVDVLRLLYTYTNGPAWIRSDNWMDPSRSVCDWYGISCVASLSSSSSSPPSTAAGVGGDDGPPPRNVDKIELSGNNLSGPVPLSILLQMPHLTVLKLDGNDVQYTQYSSQESSFFGTNFGANDDNNDDAKQGDPVVSALQWIDLSHTDISAVGSSSSSPSSSLGISKEDALGRTLYRTGSNRRIVHPHLTDLYLTGTRLHGPFPHGHFVDSSPRLERLVLDLNDLTGTIPEDVGTLLKELRYFSMRDNELTGTIPMSLGGLRKIRYLILRGNHFVGTLPRDLSEGDTLPFLEHLDLSRQRDSNNPQKYPGLTGPLPAFMTTSNLRQLDLSFNGLTGPVPVDFLRDVNPSLFDYAFLGNNELTGKLSAESLLRLPDDAVFLEDNLITDIDPALCSKERSGTVSAFGCAAILCPPNTYGPGLGRQEDSSRPCEPCPGNRFWGGTECSGFGTEGGSQQPTQSPTPDPTARTELSEMEILLKLYEEMGGPGWLNNDGWKEAHEDSALNVQLRRLGEGGGRWRRRRTAATSFCEWHGVECAAAGDDVTGEDTVEYLMLGANKLTGKPPKELFHLRNLRTLSLADNTIAFSFDGIDEARRLSSLDLANTGLFDISGIEGVADTLEELRLDGNDIGGGRGLPPEIYRLQKLEELSLDSCGLTGPLEPSIGQLSNLISLSLSNNILTGPIPDELSDLLDLSTLQLRNNRLRGNLPSGIKSMTSLNVLDLSWQWNPEEDVRAGLVGDLPSFSDFAVLRKLDLSFNSFNGSIPENFLESISQSTPVGFEFTDLSSNRLGGTVPEIVSKLRNVFMKDNQITGIHPAVCSSVVGTSFQPFGCDAVLCEPGTFNALGRQTTFDLPCKNCGTQGGAPFFGSIACVASDGTEALSTAPPPGEGTDPDRWILELIYTTCNGNSWAENDGWMDDSTDICEWSGVTCTDDGNGLNLRSYGLKCTFPTEVFQFSNLETLILDGNDIDFSFIGIRDAANLRVLDLTNTGLESVRGIEDSVGLTDLFLTSNGLVGTFPQELLQLFTLETLSLAFNAITGTIPAELGLMKNVRFIDMNNNDIYGTIPLSIGQLSQLEVLLMQSNSLSGPLPEEISSLPNLLFVDLSEQKDGGGQGLSGKVPSFSVQDGIKRLDLSSNNFSGEIPSDLLKSANPEDIEFLDLSDNRMSGTVPGSLARFPVDTLYLVGNEITHIDSALCDPNLGGIVADFGCDSVLCPPQTFNDLGRQLTAESSCRPCASAKFYGTLTCLSDEDEVPAPSPMPTNEDHTAVPVTELSEREILLKFFSECGGARWTRSDKWNSTESICAWFGVRCANPDLESVEAILLSTNNIIGTPPHELFQLPNLESLVLDNNNILFSFTGISHAKRLSTLDLTQTGLFSVDGIGQAGNLKELHLASNAFQGPIPSELYVLRSLEELSLDFNSFTGLLPAEIGMLPNLKLLSCASNDLGGMLPLSLGALTSLITLRLEGNSFTGSLPDGLGLLKNLAFLDLSHQIDASTGTGGFTGPLPSLKNLGKIRRLDLSKNSLTGSIPKDFLAGASNNFFEYADLSSNHISGTVPMELAVAGLNNIYLQDNLITDIGAYCTASALITSSDGFGCDAFLCPPDTFSPSGRQETSSSLCEPCPGAKFFGTTECDGVYEKESPPLSSEINDDAERTILEKLYDTTDGYRWHDNTNWKKDNESVCRWKGVRCSDKGETVEEINLGANNLKGTPPAELFRLPNLKVLSLYSNPLSGFSFSEIERSQSLEVLLLDATGIASVDGVGRSKVLKRLNLRFNDLKGSFPAEFTQLKTLETLNLAHNRLEGTLPPAIQGMQKLQALLLSGNSFQGKLDNVTFPSTVRRLDFSENELSGSIPELFLRGIPEGELLDIDLHDNLLTGVVPKALGRFEKMNLLLADNFIGGIARDLCKKVEWNDGDIGRYGCDGLLCPTGQFAPNGRQTSDSTICKPCPSSQFLGSTSCDGIGYESEGQRLRIGPSYLSTLLAIYLLSCSLRN